MKFKATAGLQLLHWLLHVLPAVGTVCMLRYCDRLALRGRLVALQASCQEHGLC